jgi:uncharacterized protein with FMN-binding domain
MLGDRMNKRMKKGLLIFGSVAGLLVMIVASGLIWISRGLDTLETVEFSQTSFEVLEDGVYEGRCDEGRWTTTVELTVEEGSIESITLIDDVTFREEGVFEDVKAQVIASMSLDIDAVSGATLTSNAYLTAIEDALMAARNE